MPPTQPPTQLNADLHCHSTASDGVLTPTQLAALAFDNGVALWALTDHDDMRGQAEAAQAAQNLGLRFISGVEISVTWRGATIHVVGLNLDPAHPELLAGLARVRSGREVRARQIGEKLAALGMPGAYVGALPYANNPALISRTHFARFLVAAGHCPDIQTVFKRYLGDGGPADAPIEWATLSEALGWIHAAGGRAVIAHPGRYKYSGRAFARLYQEFRDLGGAGVEVVTGSHSREQYRRYAEVARRYGFLASRGSDFHSAAESRCDLGQLPPLPDGLTPVWHDWV